MKRIDVQGGVHLYHLIDDNVSVGSDRSKSSWKVIPCDSRRVGERALFDRGSDATPWSRQPMMRQFLGGVSFIVGEVSMCVAQIPVGGMLVERYASLFVSIVLKKFRTGVIAA